MHGPLQALQRLPSSCIEASGLPGEWVLMQGLFLKFMGLSVQTCLQLEFGVDGVLHMLCLLGLKEIKLLGISLSMVLDLAMGDSSGPSDPDTEWSPEEVQTFWDGFFLFLKGKGKCGKGLGKGVSSLPSLPPALARGSVGAAAASHHADPAPSPSLMPPPAPPPRPPAVPMADGPTVASIPCAPGPLPTEPKKGGVPEPTKPPPKPKLPQPPVGHGPMQLRPKARPHQTPGWTIACFPSTIFDIELVSWLTIVRNWFHFF